MINDASSHASSYGGSQLPVGACDANGMSRRTLLGIDESEGTEETEESDDTATLLITDDCELLSELVTPFGRGSVTS